MTGHIISGKLLGNRRVLKPLPWYLAYGLTTNDVIGAYNARVENWQRSTTNLAHPGTNTLAVSPGYYTYHWYYDYGWVMDAGALWIPSVTVHQDLTVIARFDRFDLFMEIFGVKNNGIDFFFDYPDIGYAGHIGSASWQRNVDDFYFTVALNRNGTYRNGELFLASSGNIENFSYTCPFVFGGYYDVPTQAVVPNFWQTNWIAIALYNKVLTPEQIRIISRNMINIGPNYSW